LYGYNTQMPKVTTCNWGPQKPTS